MRNNVRIMRNSSVLTALFPQVRQGVLAATLGQPHKWWYLSELADRLGTSPSSLQRELSLWSQADYSYIVVKAQGPISRRRPSPQCSETCSGFSKKLQGWPQSWSGY